MSATTPSPALSDGLTGVGPVPPTSTASGAPLADNSTGRSTHVEPAEEAYQWQQMVMLGAAILVCVLHAVAVATAVVAHRSRRTRLPHLMLYVVNVSLADLLLVATYFINVFVISSHAEEAPDVVRGTCVVTASLQLVGVYAKGGVLLVAAMEAALWGCGRLRPVVLRGRFRPRCPVVAAWALAIGAVGLATVADLQQIKVARIRGEHDGHFWIHAAKVPDCWVDEVHSHRQVIIHITAFVATVTTAALAAACLVRRALLVGPSASGGRARDMSVRHVHMPLQSEEAAGALPGTSDRAPLHTKVLAAVAAYNLLALALLLATAIVAKFVFTAVPHMDLLHGLQAGAIFLPAALDPVLCLCVPALWAACGSFCRARGGWKAGTSGAQADPARDRYHYRPQADDVTAEDLAVVEHD